MPYTKAETAARFEQALRREPLTLAQVQRDHAEGRGTKAAKVAMLRLVVKRGNVTPEARQWCAEQADKLAEAV
jgi:hypothetical protein